MSIVNDDFTNYAERRRTRKTSITPAEELQLIGLITLAKDLNAQLDKIARSAVAITGEIDEYGDTHTGGHTYDAIWGSIDVPDLLRRLDLVVQEPEASPSTPIQWTVVNTDGVTFRALFDEQPDEATIGHLNRVGEAVKAEFAVDRLLLDGFLSNGATITITADMRSKSDV